MPDPPILQKDQVALLQQNIALRIQFRRYELEFVALGRDWPMPITTREEILEKIREILDDIDARKSQIEGMPTD